VTKPKTKGCPPCGRPLFWDEHELVILRAFAARTAVLTGDGECTITLSGFV
jgi:hypothetical protein